MQSNPPRILLTNVKQLELLLTRKQDIEMFDKSQLQFLVFDEAHTFSGAIDRARPVCWPGLSTIQSSTRAGDSV